MHLDLDLDLQYEDLDLDLDSGGKDLDLDLDLNFEDLTTSLIETRRNSKHVFRLSSLKMLNVTVLISHRSSLPAATHRDIGGAPGDQQQR